MKVRLFRPNSGEGPRGVYLHRDLLDGAYLLVATERSNAAVFDSVEAATEWARKHGLPPQHWIVESGD